MEYLNRINEILLQKYLQKMYLVYIIMIIFLQRKTKNFYRIPKKQQIKKWLIIIRLNIFLIKNKKIATKK